MARDKKSDQKKTNNGANVGYEAELWQMADALRGSMDAAEYKHVVLGLIFLKYISDAFEEQHSKLEAEKSQGADPEDPDEYRALSIFWVPPEARWSHLKAQAKQPTIGQLVDDAMAGIERDNPSLKGVLPKDYARPGLDKQRLGQLIDMVSNIRVGDAESRSKDVLGRVYEYFLSQFASAEGKKGGILRDLGDEIRAGGSGGSVLTNLSTGRFAELRVLAALADLRVRYHALVIPLFDRILANEKESVTLVTLRNTLLPKLISGEIRTKDAEWEAQRVGA
jgi:hypothetical protein